MMISISDTLKGAYTFNPFALPNFLTAFCICFLGLWEFFSDRFSRPTRHFLHFTLLIGAYFLSIGAAYCATNEQAALAWTRIGFLFVPCIPASAAFWVASVLEYDDKLLTGRFLITLISLFFFLLNIFTPFLVGGVQPMWWGTTLKYGYLGWSFTFFFASSIGMLLLIIARKRARTRPGSYAKKRLNILFAASCALSLAIVDCFPGHSIEIYPFGYVSCLIFIFIIVYNKIRYGVILYSPALAVDEIFAAMDEILLVLDEIGTVILVNSAASRFFNMPTQRLCGCSVDELIPGIACTYSGFKKEDCIFQNKEIVLTAPSSTERRYFNATATIFTEGKHHISRRIVLTLLDITTRKKAEKKLQQVLEDLESTVEKRTIELTQANKQLHDEIANRTYAQDRLAASEEKYRHLFDHAPDAILLIEPVPADSFVVIAANQAALDMFKLKKDNIVNQDIKQFTDPDFSLELSRFFGQFHKGSWIKGESQGKKDDSSFFPIEYTAGITSFSGANYLLIFARDISELRSGAEKITYLALYDPLTGLPNRSLYSDRLKNAVAYAQRHKETLAVIFLDIDRFKHVNDSLGHAEGDKLLIEISQRLTQCLREEDTVARLGGDEFILLIRNLEGAKQAELTAKRILMSFSRPIFLQGNEFYAAASLGISLYPDHGTGVDSLVKNADLAMYRAKEAGGNKYVLYSPSMDAQVQWQLTMESKLRKALEREEFVLYYQPIVDLQTGQTVTLEALLRWRQEEGIVAPSQFIGLAEETGLILSIDEYVLNKACKEMALLQAYGQDTPRVSVNISAKQFMQKNMVQTVEGALTFNGLPARFLKLEITESAIMTETGKGSETLKQLGAMGVNVSLDDFGTGYSSLNYLKRLPVTELKIDRSFIQDIPASSEDMAIVQAIVTLGRNLGIDIVAEGVETREHLDFLRKLGCRYAQGYYFSKPVPYEQLQFDYTAKLAGESS